MGAQQSSEGASAAEAGGSRKTCYYEVLGVDSQAADEESALSPSVFSLSVPSANA